MQAEQVLDATMSKLKALPPARLAEVLDFIEFLETKEQQHGWTRTALSASEPALQAVWDNPEDAAYDRL